MVYFRQEAIHEHQGSQKDGGIPSEFQDDLAAMSDDCGRTGFTIASTPQNARPSCHLPRRIFLSKQDD
jgi:hypothetical protein